MSLVVGSLEKEGVRVMRECEPRAVRRVRGEGEEGRGEEGMLEVTWYCRNTQETNQVCVNSTHVGLSVCVSVGLSVFRPVCLSVSLFSVFSHCYRKNGTQCYLPQVSD